MNIGVLQRHRRHRANIFLLSQSRRPDDVSCCLTRNLNHVIAWVHTIYFWWLQTERQMAADPQARPTNQTVCLSVGCYHPHPISPFIITTQAESLSSFHCPIEDEKLSWPRYYSKGVLKGGCVSQLWCLWWNFNLGPLTLPSTISLLQPAVDVYHIM